MGERLVACIAWTIVALLRLVILPVHIVALLLERGCNEVITYTTEMQAATVERMKAGK
jgi:hypothetical protein